MSLSCSVSGKDLAQTDLEKLPGIGSGKFCIQTGVLPLKYKAKLTGFSDMVISDLALHLMCYRGSQSVHLNFLGCPGTLTRVLWAVPSGVTGVITAGVTILNPTKSSDMQEDVQEDNAHFMRFLWCHLGSHKVS